MTDGGSAIPEVHALLRVLAADRTVLELGTAFGVGAAALAGTARSVLTVELDAGRATAARERLRDCPNVELLEGDWREVLRGRASFGLVFADGGSPYAPADWEAILALVEPGGLLVKDDLTPGRPIDGDRVREFLLRDPRLAAAEILTNERHAAIVAVRLPC